MKSAKTLFLAILIFWGRSLPDCLCGSRKKGVKALQVDFFSTDEPEVRLEILKLAMQNYNRIAASLGEVESPLPSVHSVIEGGKYRRRVYQPRSGVPNVLRDISFDQYSYTTMEKYVFRLGDVLFYVYYVAESVNKLSWQLRFSTQELDKDKWDFPDDQAQLAASGPFAALKGRGQLSHTASFSYTDGNQLAYDVCADFQIFLNKLLLAQLKLPTGLTSKQLREHVYTPEGQCRGQEGTTTFYLPDTADLLARKTRRAPPELKDLFKQPRPNQLKPRPAQRPTAEREGRVVESLPAKKLAVMVRPTASSLLKQTSRFSAEKSALSTEKSALSTSRPSTIKMLNRKKKLEQPVEEPIIEEREIVEEREKPPRKMFARKQKVQKDADEPVVEERQPQTEQPLFQRRPALRPNEEYRERLRPSTLIQRPPLRPEGEEALLQPRYISKIPVLTSPRNPVTQPGSAEKLEKAKLGSLELGGEGTPLRTPAEDEDEDEELAGLRLERAAKLAQELRRGFRVPSQNNRGQSEQPDLELEVETIPLTREDLPRGTGETEGVSEPETRNPSEPGLEDRALVLKRTESVLDLSDFSNIGGEADDGEKEAEEREPFQFGLEDLIEENRRDNQLKTDLRALRKAQGAAQRLSGDKTTTTPLLAAELEEQSPQTGLRLEGDEREPTLKLRNQKVKRPPTENDDELEELEREASQVRQEVGQVEKDDTSALLGQSTNTEDELGEGRELNGSSELEEDLLSSQSQTKQTQATRKRLVRKPATAKQRALRVPKPEPELDVQFESELLKAQEAPRVKFSEEDSPGNAADPRVLESRRARFDELEQLLSAPASELFARFEHPPSEAFYERMDYDLLVMRQDGLFRPAALSPLVLWPEGSSIPIERVTHPGNPDSRDFRAEPGSPAAQQFQRKLKFVKRLFGIARQAREQIGGDFNFLKFRVHADLAVEPNLPELLRDLVLMAFLTSPESYYLKPLTIAKVPEPVKEVQRQASIKFLYDPCTRTFVVDDVSDLTDLEEFQMKYHREAVADTVRKTLLSSKEDWTIAVLNFDSTVITREELLKAEKDLKRALI